MKILIRADANSQIGLGHVSRCVSLALELEKLGVEVLFLARENKVVKEFLEEHEMNYYLFKNKSIAEELKVITNFIKNNNFKIGIFDSYELNSNQFYMERINELSEFTVVSIEGYKKYPIQADIIVNPNLFAEDRIHLYDAAESKLLFGPQYALLSSVYNEVELKEREFNNRVLVTFGGADVKNLTVPVLKTLFALDNITIDVVVGPYFENKKEIRSLSQKKENINYYYNLSNLLERYVEADICICAAGSTILELIKCNVPILTYFVAENQKLIADKVEELELGYNLGRAKYFSKSKLSEKVSHLLKQKNKYNKFLNNCREMINNNSTRTVAEEIIDYYEN